MLEGGGIDPVRSGCELAQIFVTLNAELAGNLPQIFLSTMFTVAFRAMLLMSGDEIRLLM